MILNILGSHDGYTGLPFRGIILNGGMLFYCLVLDDDYHAEGSNQPVSKLAFFIAKI
jgi:hypothetical protein